MFGQAFLRAHVKLYTLQGNPQCRQIPWGRDAALIDAWKFGRTGYPFIDAIMTQLRVEGTVACVHMVIYLFLTLVPKILRLTATNYCYIYKVGFITWRGMQWLVS